MIHKERYGNESNGTSHKIQLPPTAWNDQIRMNLEKSFGERILES